jgi:hypothetical protein
MSSVKCDATCRIVEGGRSRPPSAFAQVSRSPVSPGLAHALFDSWPHRTFRLRTLFRRYDLRGKNGTWEKIGNTAQQEADRLIGIALRQRDLRGLMPLQRVAL